MKPTSDAEVIESNLPAIHLELAPHQLDQLDCYARELRLWAARINLVSPGDLPRLATRHLIDSLAVLPALRARLASARPLDVVADLGSGAGLPGIPVAIALGSRRLILVERERRRVSFLRACVRVLPDVPLEVVEGDVTRVELPEDRRPIAIVTRAAFPLDGLLETSRRLLRPGGWLLAHRSPPEEDTARPALGDLRPDEVVSYRLPDEERPREIQIWRLCST